MVLRKTKYVLILYKVLCIVCEHLCTYILLSYPVWTAQGEKYHGYTKREIWNLSGTFSATALDFKKYIAWNMWVQWL
jgi:hypothetical protein